MEFPFYIFGGSLMRKPAIGKIFIVAILALGLVSLPMSRQTTKANTSQDGYRKISAQRQLHQHNLKASNDRGIFTLRKQGNETVCQDATVEDIEKFNSVEQDLPMHVLNPKSELVTQSLDGLTLTLRGTNQLEANPQAKAAYIRAATLDERY